MVARGLDRRSACRQGGPPAVRTGAGTAPARGRQGCRAPPRVVTPDTGRQHAFDQPTRRKLARGRLPVEAKVDLHGLTQADAHGFLLSFLHAAHGRGLRYVLVVTGKGASFGSDGVLRRAVPAWLAAPAFRSIVAGFDEAARNHGGSGALYVRLRRIGGSGVTPFAERIRELRLRKGVTQKEMAAALGVSAAYLSALEHGRRGVPTWPMIQKIIGYFNVIWDEADELQALALQSHARVVVDTVGLSPRATELANLLASSVERLDEETLESLTLRLRAALARQPKPQKSD